MSLNSSRLQELLRKTSIQAVQRGGENFLRSTVKHMPKDEGDLQRAHFVKSETENGVAVATIQTTGIPYAAAQYYNHWLHRLKSDIPLQIRALSGQARGARKESGLKTKTGAGKNYIYGFAYRYAKKAGLLSYPQIRSYGVPTKEGAGGGIGGLAWFHRVAEDPAAMARVNAIMAGEIRRAFT